MPLSGDADIAAITAGTLGVNATTVPLSDVERIWGAPKTGARVVLTP